MSDYISGVFQVGTVTVGASGTTTVRPALSNSPFRNLSITCRPIGASSNVRYTVSVLFDDETVEQHTFPDASNRIICHMAYPNKIFPPNISLGSLPGLRPVMHTAHGLGIKLSIQNQEASPVTFQIYSTFEEYNHPRCKALDFNDFDTNALK